MTDLDAMARAQGYPDYATMNAFLQKQQMGYRQNSGAVTRTASPQSQARPVSTAPVQASEQRGTFENWLNRVWPQ